MSEGRKKQGRPPGSHKKKEDKDKEAVKEVVVPAADSKLRPRPVDIYKKLPLVNTTEDVEFEDDSGSVVTISKSDAETLNNMVPPPRKRLNIPMPAVKSADETGASNYKITHSYIRYQPPSVEDMDSSIEYNLEKADDEWLKTHPKYGEKGDPRHQLALSTFINMMDMLEKASGRIAPNPVTLQEAEILFVEKIDLYQSTSKQGTDVYNYWLAKRQKLKKPLCRRFWPPTAINDTNPHAVFRPREKERYKLRKHRKNDMEAFKKMEMMRIDFERARNLLEMCKRREDLTLATVDYADEIFKQQIYDMTNATGKPRNPKVDRELLCALFLAWRARARARARVLCGERGVRTPIACVC
jgi:enhancer of polycomb-like protein